ncbi:MAG TPA: hypothetical protein VFF67_06915 [Thermoplasmata archaeon]|nr:hypothetical protein [Thermoplasmata archaeon]
MVATPAAEAAPGPTPSPTPPPKKPRTGMVAAIVVVVIVVVAGVLAYYYLRPKPSSSSGPNPMLEMGGFTQGQVVTFIYNGTNTFVCTPASTTFFPTAPSSVPCEVGNANQNAVPSQVPQWILVPAFAGLSVFGASSLGASARGWPMFAGNPVLADCGAAGTPTACVDHPTLLYSPFFTTVEQSIGVTAGFGGNPEGVLPVPTHDHLLNTTATFPNVPWGIIVVLVLDPNIWPDRASARCTATNTSNLSTPTGHCLTSISALDAAMVTSASDVAAVNAGNAIWKTLGKPNVQVVIPGDTTVAEANNLNGNLYIPFATQPGAPPSFPT